MTEDAKESTALKRVTIFTDGAAVPNPGVGGYGVVLRFGPHCRVLSGGFQQTTNNRMELMAVIVGLEALKEGCKVTLHSDSQYIVNAITSGAVFRWRKNGWKFNPTGTKPVKNPELWERLLTAYEKHEVEVVWVKGHARHQTGSSTKEAQRRPDVLLCMVLVLPDLQGHVYGGGSQGARRQREGTNRRDGWRSITITGADNLLLSERNR